MTALSDLLSYCPPILDQREQLSLDIAECFESSARCQYKSAAAMWTAVDYYVVWNNTMGEVVSTVCSVKPANERDGAQADLERTLTQAGVQWFRF